MGGCLHVAWFGATVELLCDGDFHLVWAFGGEAGFSNAFWLFAAAHWVC